MKQNKIKNQHNFLTDLRQTFEIADIEKKEGLTIDQWKKSNLNKYIRNGNLDKKKFEQFFHRIDANSDGTVTWDELITFLLKDMDSGLSSGQIQKLNEIKKIISAPFIRISMHRDICSLIRICESTDEYVSLSLDSIHFWKRKTLINSRSLIDHGNFASFIIYEHQMLLIIIKTSRKLLFYDLITLDQFPNEFTASYSASSIKSMSKEKFKKKIDLYNISNSFLFNIPQVMLPAIFDSSTDMVFFIGDDQGFIEAYLVTNPTRRQGSDFKIIPLIKYFIHKSSITHIDIIKSKNCYATSSTDCSVIFWNFDSKKKIFNILQIYKDSNPISYFYSNDYQNSLITSGISRDAFVWSQTTQRKIFKLGGHYSQVCLITSFFTHHNESFVLTMTTKKEFKIWDSLNYRLVKEWQDQSIQRPENRFGTALFDHKLFSLITISSVPSKWQEDLTSSYTNLINSTSNHSIISCLYSKEFNQIVVVDAFGTFMVWDVQNGSRTMIRTEKWSPQTGDIFSSVLDVTNRRLITTNIRGQVSLWNFNMGSVISDLNLESKDLPITAISTGTIFGKSSLVRAGSDKSLMVFSEFEKGEFILYRTFYGHEAEITSIVTFSIGFVSASSDGQLLSWSLDSSYPIGEATLFNGSSIETMTIVNLFLYVGDSMGFIHVFSIPELKHFETFQNSHKIYIKYSILSLIGNSDLSLLFSSDNLGYVKKWNILLFPRLTLEESKINRCSKEEINSLSLVENGQFLVTSGSDLCVRIWNTGTFDYIGFFHDGSNWNLKSPSTWIKDQPFHIEQYHFIKKENKLTTLQARSMRNLPQFLVSGRSISPSNSNNNEQIISNKQEKEEKKINFQEISRTINDYLSTPPIDIRETVLFDIERETNSNSNYFKNNNLNPLIEDLSNIPQFENVFATKEKDNKQNRASTANIIRPKINTPLSSTKLSRIPLSLGIH